MTTQKASVKQIVTRETFLFIGLFFFGLVILPIGIYFVGDAVFGEYGGQGFGHFYRAISGKIRGGNLAAWFLVLAPYLAWQTIRLTTWIWQLAGSGKSGDSASAGRV